MSRQISGATGAGRLSEQRSLMPNRKSRSIPFVLVLLAAILTLPACAPHTIQGLVAEGRTPAVLLVRADEPRLAQIGLTGAVIELTLDPSSISPKSLGTFRADDEGRFRAALEQSGIGLLEYELGILCRAAGHRSVYQTMAVPPSDSRLLIILEPGSEKHVPPDDLMEQAKRIGGHGTQVR